ncbi:hypothetical protein GOP47_0007282 [Adiantum capillus-veneris]|uniref:Uncharacterized protein n=1 Tax=Adiantum capillus-veneris TaxID=13818 RepID=A0A9D4V0L3_ADICA|nr:hypothetical protein GOP47_0007282 [Adiantum capillus-veneris]
MGSKWKKIKMMLSKRLCIISPFDPSDQDMEVSRGSANDVWATRSHSQPLSKGTATNMGRGSSLNGYNTGPMIIVDTYDVHTHSAPSTPPASFSGPIPSCPSRANGFRVPRSTCSICLESMKPGQGQALFTAECSHTFHFSCIASNVRHGNQICPICRAKWKDLPWQAGLEGSRSQRSRNNSYRRAASSSSRGVDMSGSHTFTDLREGRGFHNFSFQYMDENLPSGSMYLGEPDCYDDDEPLCQSSLSDFPLGRMSLGSCDQKVQVKMFSEVSAVRACESRQRFTVLVHLKSPASSIANAEACDSPSRLNSRAPLDLVAVLDVSGSMAGRKLLLLKQAMNFVIHNLSAADRLSVVVFSSTAKRIFPLRRMGEDGQRQALQAVDALIATGGTNIAEGLRKGVKVLEECREKNPVSSIMLLSDGQDTFSMNSRRQLPFFLTRGVSDTRRLVPRSIRRSTGLGRMQIPAEEVVQDAFAQCIGGLLSVVTQDVQLTISCSAPGVFITGIHSGSYDNSILDSARHGIVKLGDLYAEEERDVLVDLKLPALLESGEPNTMSLVQAACIYKDPVTQEVIQNIADELRIMRPFAVDDGQQLISLEVDRQRNRLRTAEAIAEARSLADQGNIEAAQCGLQNARAQLGVSPSAHAGDRLCHVLESELNEIQERMANRQLYERSGRAYLLSAQSSHLRQRATTRGDSVDCLMNDYQTPSMVDMITLSQTQLPSEACAPGLPHVSSSTNSGRSLLRRASSKSRKSQ